MKRIALIKSLVVVTAVVSCISVAAESRAAPANAWNFKVYLDDRMVGTHMFEVTDAGEHTEVQSVADFKLKVLFVPAYSYQHTNTERWADDCLLEFNASTQVNGRQIQVSGTSSGAGFTVRKDSDRQVLPACVMSFAYWNPEFLKQERLLNPQTGELLDVVVERLGTDSLEVRGQRVPAARYRVSARGIDLMLWYSADDEWLGLESVAKGGRVIRYELS
ncbi:MAG: DUF6134 family protein [Gammaproteobacteria bacterium]|nr:DUF6134 family protein [Gammaproteobacteria bacterium]MDH5304512.1 DUF6134 family protein [Gammaproteobacteria bacterium]MDH5322627.1 DUF6134 family protein [Gammaproteobacteria bacterium]